MLATYVLVLRCNSSFCLNSKKIDFFRVVLQRATASSSTLPARHYTSVNTGPKGVLNDYKMAKEREEKRMKEKAERDASLIEKESMTTSTVTEDEKRKQAEKVDEMDDDELDALGMFFISSFTPFL